MIQNPPVWPRLLLATNNFSRNAKELGMPKLTFALIVAVFLIHPFPLSASSPEPKSISVVDELLRNRNCWVNKSGIAECFFSVGGGLEFTIVGVGDPSESALLVIKADFARNTHYLKYVADHGCFFIRDKKGMILTLPSEYAFVHPVSARVFQDHISCQSQVGGM